MPLWNPTQRFIDKTNLKHYMDKNGFYDYWSFYQWSIQNPAQFWLEVWHQTNIIGSLNNTVVLSNGDDIEQAVFFKDATLNFAYNMLCQETDETAIIFQREDGFTRSLTYKNLKDQVVRLAIHLQSIGVKPHDRVAGYMPNIPETIIAMLATTAIGATWTACSPDFGVQGVLDRFQQVQPKVFITSDKYHYHGKVFHYIDRLKDILPNLASVTHVCVAPIEGADGDFEYPTFKNIMEKQTTKAVNDFVFEEFPFNHPVYILYSSGTTGVPKCIVHGAGGTLIEHKKELYFHADVHPNDVIFYFTTCSWMMWHWLVCGLSLKATLVLYDGSPTYPTLGHLFELCDTHNIRFFGTSAKFLSTLQKANYSTQGLSLKTVDMIGSTGSVLSPETFDYVYEFIKKDVNLSSLSGGTDIIGCFAFGCPILPVYRGELQGPTLGLHLDVFDEDGSPLNEGKGELVCKNPFPSRPLGFFNDPTGQKYHQAYFAKYKNIWFHGDFVEWTSNNGLIIHGRSDAVLNPGGVRIGTAEIYRQVEKIDYVLESLAVGQKFDDDERIILFVVLKDGITLTTNKIDEIKKIIKLNTTPRHVPAKIIAVPDLPRTKNGKITELAVRQIIHGETVKNKEVLLKPEVLDYFENILDSNID
ncbi:MAG: Acetyl-coenzyme A synthetase [Holosporales bacterium]